MINKKIAKLAAFLLTPALLLSFMPGNNASAALSDGAAYSDPDGNIAVCRFFNPLNAEHLYTTSKGSCESLEKLGWEFEGAGWMSPAESEMPVYRLYSPILKIHHYTADKNEYNFLGTIGWDQEDVCFYSSPGKEVPVYRQYCTAVPSGAHNFTIDKKENDYLATHGWEAEGTAFFAKDFGIGALDERLTFGRTVDVKESLLAKINRARTLSGAAPVKLNSALSSLARQRGHEIAEYFSHGRSLNTLERTDFETLERCGVSAWAMGECIAAGQEDENNVLSDWSDAEKNYQNLTDPDFTDVGIALYFAPEAVPYGKNRAYKYYWVLEFAGLN